jgi:hypothetical protein
MRDTIEPMSKYAFDSPHYSLISLNMIPLLTLKLFHFPWVSVNPLAAFHRMVLARIADHQLGNKGSYEVKEPLRLSAFKREMKGAAYATQESADGRGVGLKDGLGN